jgi:hypothetical protein
MGGNFGGKNLRGKFWREYFGGGGILEGKIHSVSYNIVIGRVNICIILCS